MTYRVDRRPVGEEPMKVDGGPLAVPRVDVVPGDDVVVSVDDPELERRRTSVHDENTHQHRLR